jgi:hypothetical protein
MRVRDLPSNEYGAVPMDREGRLQLRMCRFSTATPASMYQ